MADAKLTPGARKREKSMADGERGAGNIIIIHLNMRNSCSRKRAEENLRLTRVPLAVRVRAERTNVKEKTCTRVRKSRTSDQVRPLRVSSYVPKIQVYSRLVYLEYRIENPKSKTRVLIRHSITYAIYDIRTYRHQTLSRSPPSFPHPLPPLITLPPPVFVSYGIQVQF